MTFRAVQAGIAVPYGIYDVAANTGWVNVGTDHRTPPARPYDIVARIEDDLDAEGERGMNAMTVEGWLSPLTRRGLIPNGALAAFVVGSAARGWHNARSDFDIYVVTGAEHTSPTGSSVPVPLEPPCLQTELFYEQSRRWEVTYWSQRQIDQIFAKVTWEAFEGGLVTQDTLALREEEFLARLGSCLPLIGEGWLEQSRARLAESAFRSFAVVRSLGATDDAVEDALGQLEAGDLESATISARLAFDHVIDGLLESQGEYGSHLPKWRANRFKAVLPRAISFSDYWRVETMQDYNASDPAPWITTILTLCQDLAMRVETS
ncbi:hypothetical protein GXP74_29970 [Streptacidiphilus sp. P02-A3a]|nr:hypothetical protein GXP74_29970 [Streptacidiphilus sp. P02-A3a]